MQSPSAHSGLFGFRRWLLHARNEILVRPNTGNNHDRSRESREPMGRYEVLDMTQT